MPDCNTTTEIWKDIPNTNGRYRISSHGRVWQDVYRIRNRSLTHHPEYVNLFPDAKGYMRANVTCVTGQRCAKVHVLVTDAFLGPCPKDMQRNHKDGDKRNNHVSNLEFVTGAQNMLHANALGLRGTKTRRLTDDEVREIHHSSRYNSQRLLARHYGVSQRTIWEILNGQNYKELLPR